MDLGNIGSGLAGGFVTASGLFIKEFWQDRKEKRAAESEEKTREELIELLRQQLKDRKSSEDANTKALSSLAQSVNDAVQSLRSQSGKMDFLRDSMIEVKAKIKGGD